VFKIGDTVKIIDNRGLLGNGGFATRLKAKNFTGNYKPDNGTICKIINIDKEYNEVVLLKIGIREVAFDAEDERLQLIDDTEERE
jgi:hypothetical protein